MAFKSIPEMFSATCSQGGESPALRHKAHGQWVSISWRQWLALSRKVGKGLIALGLNPQDRVCILSNTRYEWVVADMGVMLAGGVSVPIYQSNLAGECAYIMNDCGAAIIFVEDEKQLRKVLEVAPSIPQLQKIVLLSGTSDDNRVIGLQALMSLGEQGDETELNRRIENTSAQDLASFVYTSGTTGPPKGAMLTHEGFLFVTASVSSILKRGSQDETLLFLPLAHIFARIVELICIHDAVVISFAESISKLVDNIEETRPTFMASVPRIYEKIYAKMIGDVQEAGGINKAIFDFSVGVGRDISRSVQKREKISLLNSLRYKLADKLVFSKLKARFGGRLEFFVSGGAPLGKEIAEFFHAAGILILEGYGLTETTAVTNVNRIGAFRFGAVGQPIPGVEQKIAPDGEVLTRSPGNMKGYYNRPEETAEVLDAEGWLHTGDVGDFDDDGFLRITDRKKDIIITAGGKNIAPQNIENHIKGNPFISQVLVYGDKRKYCSALLTLNAEEAQKYARQHGIEAKSTAELARHPQIRRHVEDIIAERNRELASYESIKKFDILPEDFTQESGELTPTLKVRRKVITQKYKHLLDAFYEEKIYE